MVAKTKAGQHIHKCKGCGADIIFIKTIKGGKMPCDPKKITIITGMGIVYKGYQPHWDICPNADDFRKAEAEKVAAKIRERK